MSTIVLVHGGFEIEALGHRAIAVDLPVEIASDHAVFSIRPHDLAPLLVGAD